MSAGEHKFDHKIAYSVLTALYSILIGVAVMQM